MFLQLILLPLAWGYVAQDITEWLHATLDPRSGTIYQRFMSNVYHPGEGDPGAVLASTSRSDPNYAFHWIRDSSIAMDTLIEMYKRSDTHEFEDRIFEYIRFTKRIQPPELLSEPKFYMNGTVFTGLWCTPQTDGPSYSTMTLIKFSNVYLKKGGSMNVVKEIYETMIKMYMDFVIENWTGVETCDVWEEIPGDHFFTRMIQRKSLLDASDFALNVMNDPDSAVKYKSAANDITKSLDAHWDPEKKFILSTLHTYRVRQMIDTSILLAVNMCNTEGKVTSFGVTDDRVMATVPLLLDTFALMYVINRVDFGLKMTPSLGRYPEDTYNGHGASRGNPWPMLTLSLAEYYYNLCMHYTLNGFIEVTPVNKVFFEHLGVDVKAGTRYDSHSPRDKIGKQIMDRLFELSDMAIRRVRFHSDNDKISEQINRDNGYSQGARDKTWAYSMVFKVNNIRDLFL